MAVPEEDYPLIATPPRNSPLDQETKETEPFDLDTRKSWTLYLSRGGWGSLDYVITVEQSGALKVERQGQLETVLHLGPVDVARVAAAMQRLKLLRLSREYHARVYDGTQWEIVVEQGERRKQIYCSNHFPEPVLRFAGFLDALIASRVAPLQRWDERAPVSDAPRGR